MSGCCIQISDEAEPQSFSLRKSDPSGWIHTRSRRPAIHVPVLFAGIDAAKAGNMMAAGIGDARDYEKTDYRLDTIADLLRIGR